MTRLSSPATELPGKHFTVVVVGSGYGGSIAASRLARAGGGVSVGLLERGREVHPGEYPDTLDEARREMQVTSHLGGRADHAGSPTGLFDFRVGDDLSVLVGCGLGGTSLINANVSIRPDGRVFDDPRWPAALRRRSDGTLDPELEAGFAAAKAMLAAVPYPASAPPLPKLAALETSARRIAATSPGARVSFKRAEINVNFDIDGPNPHGVRQAPCKLCGDCVSGCNHGAKNTLLMNYLPDARNRGVKIYTEVAVGHVTRGDGRWVVHYDWLGAGRERFPGAPPLFLTADVVILAAGALGSTEILFRSRAAGLPTSPRLGQGFTGNGDVLGFAYNADAEVRGVGYGVEMRPHGEEVGPCITGVIDVRDPHDARKGMILEDGAIPGALGGLLPAAFAATPGQDTDRGDTLAELGRQLESLLGGPYRGAVRNTQTFLVMAHDDGRGVLEPGPDGKVRVVWRGVGEQPVFREVEGRLLEATRALGGKLVKNPLSSRLFGRKLLTVHPLGGCGMADDPERGVVDEDGQVFTGARGPDGTPLVHPGLHVLDGAMIPCPLAANPLLTISALAERSCARLARRRGFRADGGPAAAPPPAGPSTVGIRFTETMRGFFMPGETEDHERGARDGRREGSAFDFILTIETDDLDGMIASPEHPARLAGSVVAPRLSDSALAATGTFNLFVDTGQARKREMRYRLDLASREGRRYHVHGYKTIRDDPGPDLWPDTTRLFITVRDGADESAPILGRGVVEIRPVDFARQLTTIEATNARDPAERLRAVALFGRLFSGALFETYGPVSRPERVDPARPARKRRALRAPTPELVPFRTPAGVDLRLTRYAGGGKGPVLLIHGLGVSSRIFSLDTVETNLVEYLCASGYDAWLLDFRASIELSAARTQFSADDVARDDLPAAVREVLGRTGAPSLQVVAHCFGSTTFTMAMLAGLEGVRSAVCSQVSTDVVAPELTRLKARFAGAFGPLGFEELTAVSTTRDGLFAGFYDELLHLLQPGPAEERCRSAVCHRIGFMYGLLYEHDRLSDATHETLHELFGPANIRSFEHLATMVEKGRIVDFAGADVYVTPGNLGRLAIPIRFVHGAENACFKPESTARTVERLRAANGRDLYDRVVIPGYGHIDCIFGRDAARDVYPHIVAHLDRTLDEPAAAAAPGAGAGRAAAGAPIASVRALAEALAPPPASAPAPAAAPTGEGRAAGEAATGSVADLALLASAVGAVEAATTDDDVLASPKDAAGALLQSLLAEARPGAGSGAGAAAGLEAASPGAAPRAVQFDTLDIGGWARSLASWVRRIVPHRFLPPPETPEPLPGTCRLALIGDFGTGLYGAPEIARTIGADGAGFDVIFHLGDVYYAGTPREVRERFIVHWPYNRKAGGRSRALNSNHEMYSGGYGYFDTTLPFFEQPSSCVYVENDHFTLLGLDTGYKDHDLTDEQVLWVRRAIERAGDRRLVLLSHHQPFSLFDRKRVARDLVGKLAGALGAGRVAAWYWGHEHRCAIHDWSAAFRFFGRCCGHGGYPAFRDRELASAPVEAAAGDRATWRRLPGRDLVPSAIVLDGPNPYVAGKEERYGPHGYMTLELAGPRLTEVVHAPDGAELYRKDLF